MKLFKIFLSTTLILIFTSCDPETYNNVLGVFDAGFAYVKSNSPEDSPAYTRADAYQSGTGGKVLVALDAAVGTYGALTHKDVSELQGRLRNAQTNLTKTGNFSKSDYANLAGAVCVFGDELIDEHKKQKFEDKVDRLTNPNNAQYNHEFALEVDHIDYEKREIVYKPRWQHIQDLMEYRKSRNDNWVAENLQQISDISLKEYNELPDEQRQEIDLKILANEKSKEEAQTATVEETPAVEEPQKVDYSELIEGIVVADYDINSYKLSAEQKELLNKLSELLKEDESLELTVFGNTCSLGSESVNYEIGLKRANEAKNYLTETGIDANRIEVASHGYSNPVADNSTESGRKSNRRITFKLK